MIERSQSLPTQLEAPSPEGPLGIKPMDLTIHPAFGSATSGVGCFEKVANGSVKANASIDRRRSWAATTMEVEKVDPVW